MAIPFLIENATDGTFQENFKEKHRYDAKYGWYKYCIRFSLPVCDDKKNVVGRNIFKGTMLIRHAFDGKKYLYDIIDIKKET